MLPSETGHVGRGAKGKDRTRAPQLIPKDAETGSLKSPLELSLVAAVNWITASYNKLSVSKIA